MHRWLCGAALCWLMGGYGVFAAPKTAPVAGEKSAALVDMSIEWLPYARPPIQINRQTDTASQEDTAWGALPEVADKSVKEPKTWSLSTDDRRLSIVLQRWCALAGWQLVWEAERDFPIEVNVKIRGDFSTALEKVMKSLADSDYPLQGVVNAQTRVLRVRRQHESMR